ncbi:SxtJ family membrane protein [Allochromatium palmeri]|uniref:SxtJ n=1 Tax=Allochromatium palmeri TaxID=231048 RepID=A0A6N8EBA3_9GAMM|nr:SxtJ family membrane protein [Allochromatium palmeri]MTW19807.1 sxtJ [Allochromatium palmeri]
MHPIPEIDTAGLRRFGLITGGLLAALFGLVLPWLAEARLPLWPWVIAAILAVWALASPKSLRPVYRGWMRFGQFANRIVTPILLSVIYLALFTPIGLVMRLFGHDPMRRALDRNATSYREASPSVLPQSMERPF